MLELNLSLRLSTAGAKEASLQIRTSVSVMGLVMAARLLWPLIENHH